MSKFTRFRAYQLGTPGSSFSYSVDNYFTLIEARFNKTNAIGIYSELKMLNIEYIDCLHITSWDQDHCDYTELSNRLKYLKPNIVEYPGYPPHTENAKYCKVLIASYQRRTVSISPEYIDTLDTAEARKYSNILYNPISTSDNSNDNSVVQLFRGGRFSLLSLGDCEDPQIANRLIRSDLIAETDVMILAHHGADNGFTTEKLIEAVKPKIAICSSNYDCQYDHPAQKIRNILWNSDVTLYTTKTGDVIIECGDDNNVKAYNLVSNNSQVASIKNFRPKLIIE